MAFLLTWHGTLLCRLRQGGGLVHRPPLPVSDDVEPVVLDLPVEQLQPGFGHHLRATLPELPVNPPGELQRFRLQWAGDQRTVTLQHEAAFLSADPNSDRVTLFRTEAGGMETFLPLSPADLDALRVILASSWLIRSSGGLAERPTTGKLFHLHVGDLAADLRFQMPFDLASWPDRLTLLRDGWRIDQICHVPAADLLRRVRQLRDPRTVRNQRPIIDRVRALPGTDPRVDRPDAAGAGKVPPGGRSGADRGAAVPAERPARLYGGALLHSGLAGRTAIPADCSMSIPTPCSTAT